MLVVTMNQIGWTDLTPTAINDIKDSTENYTSCLFLKLLENSGDTGKCRSEI